MKRAVTLLALVALATTSESNCMFKKLGGFAKTGYQKTTMAWKTPQVKAITALTTIGLATMCALIIMLNHLSISENTKKRCPFSSNVHQIRVHFLTLNCILQNVFPEPITT